MYVYFIVCAAAAAAARMIRAEEMEFLIIAAAAMYPCSSSVTVAFSVEVTHRPQRSAHPSTSITTAVCVSRRHGDGHVWYPLDESALSTPIIHRF